MKTFVFDTETTSLIANSALPLDLQPRAYELYGKTIESKVEWPTEAEWEVVWEIDQLFDPGIPIPKISSQITGITDDMVRGKPKIGEFLPRVIEELGNVDAVVAHNLSYDMAILEFEAQRAGLKIEWPRYKFCTVENTHHLKGHRMNLSDLHEHLFGEPFKGAHRAKADVEALERCYRKLVELGEM